MQHKLPIGITVVGAVVVVLAGVLGWIVIPKVIDDKIAGETQLKPNSETWDKWADIPYPIFLLFHVFHVTNPDQVEKEGATPKFIELGPYAYSQSRTKENLTQMEGEETLQYRERKVYFFDAGMSCSNCTEDDLANVINIAFVAVVHGVNSKIPFFTPQLANKVLKGETLIRRNVKVGELLFEGFDVKKYTESLGNLLPTEFSGGRFGLYKGENGSDSLWYNIYTGVGDHKKFGFIKEYDGKNTLGFWKPNTDCDILKGSDGSLYPPFVEKDRKIDVFSTDLCRSLTFTFEDTTEVKGIEAYRFTVPKWTLEDPRINVENQCYCMTKELEDCPRAGAMSLETCRGGAPIMMSTPYFLDADEGYWKASGLPEAIRENHVTHLDIEPHSGVLLRGHKRIQVNVDVKKLRGVDEYKNLKGDIVFPLVWADEYAEMDEVNADDLKGKLIKPLQIVDIAKWVVLGVGVVLFGAGIIFYIVKRRKSNVTV